MLSRKFVHQKIGLAWGVGRTNRSLRAYGLVAVIVFLSVSRAVADAGDQTLKLSPIAGGSVDFFGNSISVSENRVIIGAPLSDENVEDSGAAYVFDIFTGEELGRYAPVDGQMGDAFGFSVAIDGHHAVVGAPFDDDGGEDAGLSYLLDDRKPGELVKLFAPATAPVALFGFSVDLSDNRVIVGAPADRNSSGLTTGAAYLFDVESGELVHKFTPSTGGGDDDFGTSVAIDGVNVIIGADGSNSAYIFDGTTGNQLVELRADDNMPSDLFGFAVDISGNTAIVGAPAAINSRGESSGAAYVFNVDTGQQEWKLLPAEGDFDDFFGESVVVSGRTAVVGASLVDANGVDSGSAYVFDVTTGDQLFQLVSDDAFGFDFFGTAVALGDGVAAVGAPGAVADDAVLTGVVYTFELSQEESPALQPGDADQDLDFDQFDLVQVQAAGKYLSGAAATWGDGDWNAAPGGSPGNPPPGDGFFNQLDIIAASWGGRFQHGPYAVINTDGREGDGQTSIIYNPNTGEVAVDAPPGVALTSISIDSSAAIFTGDAAANLGGSFDNDADNNIFKATFGSSFASLSFGNVAQTGLSEEFVASDLSVVGSRAGGGDLGAVDLIYVPEPSSVLLLALGLLGAAATARHTHVAIPNP